MRILVVDDDEHMRQMLCLLLVNMGHQVIETDNGKKALKICETECPDVMVTDIVMPEKEGIETIIETHRAYPAIKIIAISGGGVGSAATYLNLAVKLGASYSLAKPFSEQELALALDKVTKTGE